MDSVFTIQMIVIGVLTSMVLAWFYFLFNSKRKIEQQHMLDKIKQELEEIESLLQKMHGPNPVIPMSRVEILENEVTRLQIENERLVIEASKNMYR
jgi:hypothetical protein